MINGSIKPFLYSAVRSGFNSIGFELRRARPTTEDFPRLAHFLKQRKVATVIDVGANRGQFAKGLFDQDFNGEIISFEPLPQMHALLKFEAIEFGERWRIAPEMALSDQRGAQTFNVSSNFASSSLLPVMSSSVEAAPESVTVSTITVQTDTLDAILPTLNVKFPIFLKIDAQGAETAVLEGARDSLKKIDGVKLELSLDVLYSGQEMAHQLDRRLLDLGFNCWDVVPGFRNRETGRLLQYDGVYFRAN